MPDVTKLAVCVDMSAGAATITDCDVYLEGSCDGGTTWRSLVCDLGVTDGGTAFTTWLDPILASKQAEAVRARLANVRPEHSTAFQRNFDALKTDLENLDHEIARTVPKWRDSPVLFSHPVYQYFERQYGLKAKSVPPSLLSLPP